MRVGFSISRNRNRENFHGPATNPSQVVRLSPKIISRKIINCRPRLQPSIIFKSCMSPTALLFNSWTLCPSSLNFLSSCCSSIFSPGKFDIKFVQHASDELKLQFHQKSFMNFEIDLRDLHFSWTSV